MAEKSKLQERREKEKKMTPTQTAVLGITGKKGNKDKYPVNVVFDGADEERIRARAKEMGLGVATYIKMLVSKDLNNG